MSIKEEMFTEEDLPEEEFPPTAEELEEEDRLYREADDPTKRPPTIASLRSIGCQVMVRHVRIMMPGEPMTVTLEFGIQSSRGFGSQTTAVNCYESKINPKGGMTEVYIKDLKSGHEYSGLAKCSKKDSYCKKTGVMIALSRALFSMGWDKDFTDAMREFAVGREARLKEDMKNYKATMITGDRSQTTDKAEDLNHA